MSYIPPHAIGSKTLSIVKDLASMFVADYADSNILKKALTRIIVDALHQYDKERMTR